MEVPCRIRFKANEDAIPTALRDHPDIPLEIRRQWAQRLARLIQTRPDDTQYIRPLEFLLHPDGSVVETSTTVTTPTTTAPDAKQPDPPSTDDDTNLHRFYPARFRIPPSSIEDLDQAERVKRAELFALGSLLYQIYTGIEPFEDEVDNEDEVQRRFSRVEFPDVTNLPPGWLIILACWSLEFAYELRRMVAARNPTTMQRLQTHITNNPAKFGLQVIGGTLFTLGAITPLVLTGLGFSAIGPVPGSAAAAWQASLGVVQAGSLFAWCQSAAMGGAAVNGIIAVVAAGGVVAGAGSVDLIKGLDVPEDGGLVERFREVCRRGNANE